jgi:hypothetical protein
MRTQGKEVFMSTNNDAIYPVAVLMLPYGNKDLITFARAVLCSMLANPIFASVNPSLTVFAADIDEFDEAETKASLRTKGAAAIRDAKKRKVKEDLFHLRDSVQSVVEATPNPAAAAAVIESANMSVRKAPKRAPTPDLSAKNTDILGKVALAAKPVARAATYYWEYSLDTSNWTALPETMQTRIELPGLTSARVYYFRYRALTKEGQRDYSPVVSLYVH